MPRFRLPLRLTKPERRAQQSGFISPPGGSDVCEVREPLLWNTDSSKAAAGRHLGVALQVSGLCPRNLVESLLNQQGCWELTWAPSQRPGVEGAGGRTASCFLRYQEKALG